MRSLTIVCILLLSACATSKATHLPDGRIGHSINCSGAALSWNLCYEKAGEICGSRGYDVVAQNGEQGTAASGTQAGVFVTPMVNRTMLVKCK